MTAADTTTQAPRKEAAGVLKRSSAFFIDPRAIAIDPEWNNRFDMGDIDGLASSIKHEVLRDPQGGGLLEDIGVSRLPKGHPLRLTVNPLDKKGEEVEKEFVVRYGHRRTTAVWMNIAAGIPFPVGIPAKILDKGQDLQSSVIQMVAENVGQKPLLPMEEAAAYKKLYDGFPNAEPPIKGMSIKDICKAVGRAVPHVTEMLALLDADDSVKEAVKDGTIGKQMAKTIASRAKGDKETQKKLVAAAKTAGKTKGGKAAVKLAAENVKRTAAGKALKMRALTDAQLSSLGKKLASEMVEKMKEAGKPLEFDVRAWVKLDDNLALAFTFGALEALKAAAGVKIELSI